MITYDLAAEEALLGAMLYSSQAIDVTVDTCTSADFHKPSHANIFEVITALHRPGERVDPVLVAGELERIGQPVPLTDLTHLLAEAPGLSSVRQLAAGVKRQADRRRLLELAQTLRTSAESGDIDAAVPEVIKRLEEIGQGLIAGHRRVTFTSAADIQPRPTHWLWKGRLPLGSLALLSGREGIGKSTLAYQLVADITRGRLAGAYFGQPKGVIICAEEDSWDRTIVPRLMGAGADLSRVQRVEVRTAGGYNGSLSLPRDLEQVRRGIRDHDAALLLLDPLMSRLDASLDTHKDAEVRRALEPTVAIADETGAAVLGLIHVNKSTSEDALTLVMGSRAFVAVARAVLFVALDPDDPNVRILGQPKNNLGRSDLPSLTFTISGAHVADTDEGPVWSSRINWTGETERSIADVIRSAGETGDMRSAVAEAGAWLADYLTIHRAAASKAIKKAAHDEGHAPATLARARAKIGAGILPHGFPCSTHWSAPGMTPDEAKTLLDQRLPDQQLNQT